MCIRDSFQSRQICKNIDSSTDDNPSDSTSAVGSSTFCSNHSAPTVSVAAVIDLLSDVDCNNVFAMMSNNKNQSPPSDNDSDDSSSDEEKTPPAPLISHSLRTELELMKIVTKIKAPLCSCKGRSNSVPDWILSHKCIYAKCCIEFLEPPPGLLAAGTDNVGGSLS